MATWPGHTDWTTTTTTGTTPGYTTPTSTTSTSTASITSSLLPSSSWSSSAPPSSSSTTDSSTTDSSTDSSTSTSSSTTSSSITTPTPSLPQDPSLSPIQSSTKDEHLARNICVGIFSVFAVVAMIGVVYWSIPWFRRKLANRKSRRVAELPFANDEKQPPAGGIGARHRSIMLMPGRNNSIVSFDSRTPAEKEKSNVNSPASLAFSPPVSPKSPALWTGEAGNNDSNVAMIPPNDDENIDATTAAVADTTIDEVAAIPPAVAIPYHDNTNTTSASAKIAKRFSRSNSLRFTRSILPKKIPRAAAPMPPPPKRPLSRPPPLNIQEMERAVFYSHAAAAPSMTTVASYPYEDEDSSLWAFVPPQSPFGINRPSSPPVSQMPNAPRRDSDTYPRTQYL